MTATALDPKTALVVIDLQKGLSALPALTPFSEIVARTARLAAAFRRSDLPVVLVTAGFSPDLGDRFHARTDAPARITTMAPDFAELVSELSPQPGDIVLVKRNPSAFYGTELDLQLRRRGVTGIVLAGVSTSNGVDTTAREALERAYNVTFAVDAITDVDPVAHDFVTKKIFPKLGESDTTEAILALLSNSPHTTST